MTCPALAAASTDTRGAIHDRSRHSFCAVLDLDEAQLRSDCTRALIETLAPLWAGLGGVLRACSLQRPTGPPPVPHAQVTAC